MTWAEKLFEWTLSGVMFVIICGVVIVGTPIKWAAQVWDYWDKR